MTELEREELLDDIEAFNSMDIQEGWGEEDVVNNPSHYTSGKYEAIDIIEDVTKDLRGLQAFACGNALKYVIRHNKKGKSIEDLNKSIFYIKKMIKDLEEGSDIPF